jgi:hypothetical protein
MHIVVETDCQLLVIAWEKDEGHMLASNQVLREMKATHATLYVISLVVTYEKIPGFRVEPIQLDTLSLME